MKKVLAVIAVVAVIGSLAYAGPGTSGAQFLKIMPSVRASAMGDAGSTISGVESIYINPAGLAKVKKVDTSLSNASGLESMNYSNVAAAKAFSFGVMGVAINSLSMPSIKKYDRNGADTGEYSASDLALRIGYGRAINDSISVGVNVKAVNCTIDDVTASATCIDAGGAMSLMDENLLLGLVVQNAGTGLKFVDAADALPFNIKLGANYGFLENKVRVSLDLNSGNDSGLSGSLGVECGREMGEFNGCVRAGYSTLQTANEAGLTLGIGMGYRTYSMDIAIIPVGEFGSSSRISLGAKF